LKPTVVSYPDLSSAPKDASLFSVSIPGASTIYGRIWHLDLCLVEVRLMQNKTQVSLSIPKIPSQILQACRDFFTWVSREHQRSEACVILYYSPHAASWLAFAPTQAVNQENVHWEIDEEIPQGFYYAGSIHSHVLLKPYHSQTDINDEIAWDGFHIVTNLFGEFVASIVVSGFHFSVSITDIAEVPEQKFPLDWQAKVTFDPTLPDPLDRQGLYERLKSWFHIK